MNSDILKEEALKFVDEVRETFLHTNDSDNKSAQFCAALLSFYDNQTTSEALTQTLINLFQGHRNLLSGYHKLVTQAQNPAKKARTEKEKAFLKRLKAENGEIYSRVETALTAHRERELGKTQLYTKVCALLIGQPDLFRLFETLLIDGTEESRREIETLRLQVKRDFLGEVGSSVENYKSTIRAVEEVAAEGKGLAAEHLRRAAEMYYGDDQELRKQKKMKELVARLRKDPDKVCRGVLPRMEMKVQRLLLTHDFISQYFDRAFSHTV